MMGTRRKRSPSHSALFLLLLSLLTSYDNVLSLQAGTYQKERPLLHQFGRGIAKRVRHSNEGEHRFGAIGAYTSEETIPCLNMRGSGSSHPTKIASCRNAIRRAFSESSMDGSNNTPHGRSSGSGCVIIRLTGKDATSIHGLTKYGERFFEQVDSDQMGIMNAGVFRIDNHVYAGFDNDVNGEGKMQFLDSRILPAINDDDPILLPLEVGDLVGETSMSDAHNGMDTLLDIGTQITSAILDMSPQSTRKLIDDGTHLQEKTTCNGQTLMKEDVSNSYHRLIRYLKPQQDGDGTAFKAHVDSSFLTIIPMPELPGLEVWCPSTETEQSTKGEWVRPAIDSSKKNEDCAYITALAGEFLQITSNGQVPTCIHRVTPPKAPKVFPGGNHDKYKPRVSAPLFLRPRRGEEAVVNVRKDLKLARKASPNQSSASDALYFEEGLLEECDSMHLWSIHGIISKKLLL